MKNLLVILVMAFGAITLNSYTENEVAQADFEAFGTWHADSTTFVENGVPGSTSYLPFNEIWVVGENVVNVSADTYGSVTYQVLDYSVENKTIIIDHIVGVWNVDTTHNGDIINLTLTAYDRSPSLSVQVLYFTGI
jgi:hypothetical protein